MNLKDTEGGEPLRGLVEEIRSLPQMRELTQALTGRERCAAVTGLAPVHRAMVTAAVLAEAGRPVLVLCADEKEARRQAADLAALTGQTPVMLPARELQLRPGAYSRQWENSRLAALHRMAGGAAIVVAAVDGMVQRCIPQEVLENAAFTLEVGGQYDVTALAGHLAAAGYSRCDQVEGPGQFAVRGGILDVFPPDAEQPVRCEFFDDELDSMGDFAVNTQRRVKNRHALTVLPASELLPCRTADSAAQAAERIEEAAKRLKKEHGALRQRLESDAALLRQGVTPPGGDRYMAAVYPEKATAFDYLPPNAIVCVSEAGRVQESLRASLWQLRQDVTAAAEGGVMAAAFGDLMMTEGELESALGRFPVCQLESLPTSRYLLPPKLLLDIAAKQLAGYGGSLDTAAGDIEHYRSSGCGVLVLCGGEVRCRNMQELLQQRDIPAALALDGQRTPRPGEVIIALGALSAGSEWPALKLAVLTEGQLTRSLSGRKARPRAAKSDSRQRIMSYADLSVGDLVVHVHHGIGRFAGMIRLPVDGVEKDYIKINYAGSDCLYVPATSLDLVSKYIGGGEEAEKARLNKLSGDQWAKTTRRAKAAAKDLAEGLIRLYAQRQRLGGHAFSPDSPWQQEFEDAFDYTETEDQLAAVRDIKWDMEKPVPMDRLLCGDVGYGKTEVALRAAMKCILDGKQAAILVPTTVLAQQHYATAAARFRAFPVTVEVLSRFRTPKQEKEILQRVKEGRVDLLIGTHKLLSKDLEFRDLGLLIIDEEQRFGVTHKERLRQVAQQVDTLTLSATPIPRTLNMALSGIRDMSTIEQPPQDRQPVQTYVLEHDWGILAEAIRRELSRGGQVYYLHNRVDNIDATAARLRELLDDDAVVETAHGKMAEGELSRVMARMSEGEIDVLVCTTIIETGIDIPNVNTLIIEDADNMGLSQLHQIRGRIGRSARRAYAYLTYRTGKVLTEVAAKRLTAIREYVEFGSGFKIAMRDLEIRGAGNLLGPEQSGYMMSVGYDMYLKLLNDAVLEQQGKAVPARVECSADLTVAAYIPESYVPAPEQRMDLYRRIAALRTAEDESELTDELLDRYGDVPGPVAALLQVALLRAAAMAAGVTDITQRGRQLVFSFDPHMDAASLLAVCTMAGYRSRAQLSAGAAPKLTLYMQPKEEALAAAGGLVEALRLQQEENRAAARTEETTHEK